MAKSFLLMNKEKEDMNQYWYSQHTIETLVEEISVSFPEDTKIACVSTPSLYFSLPPHLKSQSTVFDIDERFRARSDFVLYDFNFPENIPAEKRGAYDLVVIDPPFITREVWEKYAEAARLLIKDQGKFILSSIQENEQMLEELLGVRAVPFMPSIPHLVYQYSFYTNYQPSALAQRNPEIID